MLEKAGSLPGATLEQFVEHVQYLAEKAGLAHVGIGSDFFGGRTPAGLEHVGRFPHLFAALIRRGWGDDALAGLASRNFLRVFRKVEKTGAELRLTERPRVGRVEDFDGR